MHETLQKESGRHAAAASSPPNSNNQVIGIDFSGGMGSVVAQLNAALGTHLQFSNPSGTVLQVLNNGSGNVVNSLSATSTVTSLTSGSAQLPLFTDGSEPITGAITASGSQTTGLAGRIEVNPALVASPSSLVAYASDTASRRSDAAEFHPQSDDQRVADLFADHRESAAAQRRTAARCRTI